MALLIYRDFSLEKVDLREDQLHALWSKNRCVYKKEKKNSIESPQKIMTRIIIWSSHSTPGYLSKENKNTRIYMHSCVHWSIVYNSQGMEQPKYPARDE